MGGKVDVFVNQSRGPQTFKLSRQNYHQIGSLLPPEGSNPKFTQLYIYDTGNEVENRIHVVSSGQIVSKLHAEIVSDLKKMLDEHNILAKTFRMSGQLQRINELNAAYLGLQYPLLFPYGEDGYREDISLNGYIGGDHESVGGRQRVSVREFFANKIQDRKDELPIIVYARRLFQQFLVDTYTMIELGRLKYIWTHQK
ncbi:hypothetical protein P3S68_030933 [Capsicum galapagoense]